MKSPGDKKKAFSMDEFERGLMLAGLIPPKNADELRDKAALDEYDKIQALAKKEAYFKRAVLAAEIANELHAEPTFGRVKFQKLVYICEHVAEMNLEEKYAKFAAGPFDSKFMHSIEKEFTDQEWFAVDKVKGEKMTRTVYSPLSKRSKYKEYFESYFKNEKESIHAIINLLKKSKTDHAEIIATLLACHLELKKDNTFYETDKLLSLFYEWSKEKSRFQEEQVLAVWQWMKKHRIILSNRL